MSKETIETLIAVVGIITLIVYFRWDSKIESKVSQAGLILLRSDKYDSGYVSRVMRQERVAIRAMAKLGHVQPENLACWIESRLLRED